MDVGGIASALIASRTAQMQIAIAGKLLRMNAQADASVAQLLAAAADNGEKLAAAVSSGSGAALDITV